MFSKKVRKEGYNGYRNFDTWAVCATIDNDEKAYSYVSRNKHKLLGMKKKDKLREISRNTRNGNMKDVSFDNVDYRELNNFISEL